MLIKKADLIKFSEITPEEVYLSRREVIAGLGLSAAACLPMASWANTIESQPWSNKLDAELTPFEKATSHNNFYELGSSKDQPAHNAGLYESKPWQVEVGGHVAKPGVFGVEDLFGLAAMQERVYRLRCVEAWSMVIPWIGYPLKKLIDKVEPTGDAKFVAFKTFNPEKLFPDEINHSLPWPYVEGLRLDEASHDLTLLTFGMYGKELLNQNGAPLRIVVPWKYGYKSIKAIVSIDFVSEMPPTSWNNSQANEYGFYSNVNPEVHHPRWSQSKERAIGEGFFPKKRETDKFNGYQEVASLYEGMDLKVNH